MIAHARAGSRATGTAETDEPAHPADAARDIALRLLAVRPRTRAELATALTRRGIPDDVVAEVLSRYADVGIIDDEAFARAWVTSRSSGRGLARRALADELRVKGVDAETVTAALDDVSDDDEEEMARALVRRKLRTQQNGRPRGRPEPVHDEKAAAWAAQAAQAALAHRLIGMLARKGYSAGLAYRVVRDVLRERADTVATADLLDEAGAGADVQPPAVP